jgi:type IV pilus assembly protein PilF
MRRLSLASAYYEQNQNDVAQQEVRAALQIDANYADAYSLLGLIHQRAKAPALAQQSFEQALQLASQPPVRSAELGAIQHNYGWFLCEQNRFAQAQIQLGRALSQPGYASADKTNKAIEFCKKRATPADTRQHNH